MTDLLSTNDPQLYHAILRTDLSSFIARSFRSVNPGTPYQPNWHIDLIAEHLNACTQGEIPRLIINMPPRALKSLSISVAWPAWLLGQNPAIRIMAASYAMPLSLKFSQDCRLLLSEPWYHDIFPNTRILRGSDEKAKFITTRRGYRLATSVGTSIIGEGGNVLIVDDPLNPQQAMSPSQRQRTSEWFEQAFLPRLDDKQRGCVVVVMQRLHADDLTGHLLSQGNHWHHLCLPAIAERRTVLEFRDLTIIREAGSLLHSEREDQTILDRAQQELGSHAFAAQYLQSPISQEASMIHAEWLRSYDRLPEAEPRRIVQSWDTAIKAGSAHDASACATWLEFEDGLYLTDMSVLRAEYPELKRAILKLAEQYQPHAILIEDKASGQSLLQDLRRETHLPLIGITPRGDKLTRLASVSAMIEAGQVYLPRYAAWRAAFEQELFSFPHGAHDDQVDAFTQYLNWQRAQSFHAIRLRQL